MPKKYTVIGVKREELIPAWEKLQKDKNGTYNIDFDMGKVFIYSDNNEEKTEECIKTFIKYVNEELCLNIPENAELICSDGDQEFDFYVGFMFEE